MFLYLFGRCYGLLPCVPLKQCFNDASHQRAGFVGRVVSGRVLRSFMGDGHPRCFLTGFSFGPHIMKWRWEGLVRCCLWAGSTWENQHHQQQQHQQQQQPTTTTTTTTNGRPLPLHRHCQLKGTCAGNPSLIAKSVFLTVYVPYTFPQTNSGFDCIRIIPPSKSRWIST